MEKAYFAGGCFWGVEHAFKQLDGVTSTRVGYQGGEVIDPTYEQVCGKQTGHAESVEVEFDPSIITLKRLCDAFFFMHDPTQLNAQGPDVGPQYRSAIFPISEEKAHFFRNYINETLDREKYKAPIVTSVEENCPFFSAELMHQDYLVNNPGGYCHIGFDVFSKLKMGQF